MGIDDHRGIVTFTDRFRYLGSILTSTLTDDVEVAQRIAVAGVAFAQLKQSVFRVDFGNRALPDRSKGRIYYSLVLGILLYGCESWLLTTVYSVAEQAQGVPLPVRACDVRRFPL